MSWKIEIVVPHSENPVLNATCWVSDHLRFATKEEAEHWLHGMARQVVETSDEVNCRYNDPKNVGLEFLPNASELEKQFKQKVEKVFDSAIEKSKLKI